MSCLRWLREAISDENGQADIAYASIAALTGAAIGALTFICTMATIAYFRCVPLIKPDVVVNCYFDPLPMGQAVGLIFGAFGALIGALAGYMAATRKPRTASQDQTVIAPRATSVTAIQPQPAPEPPAPPRLAAEAATDLEQAMRPKGKR